MTGKQIAAHIRKFPVRWFVPDCIHDAVNLLENDPVFNEPDSESSMADMTCPSCLKDFRLQWNDYVGQPNTLAISACDSGGVYQVVVRCPHCGREDELE